MGKFCVKAAIVSSLAVAEEDYNTAIGAPIEVKRNLIARSLKKGQQPGQTPQIISEGGSLRALNGEEGGCCSLNPCNRNKDINLEVKNDIHIMEKEVEDLKEMEKLNLKELKEVKGELKNGNMVSGNSIKDSAKEILTELKKRILDLPLLFLTLDSSSLGELKGNMNQTLAIANTFSGLDLPEDMGGQARIIVENLTEIKKKLDTKTNLPNEDFRDLGDIMIGDKGKLKSINEALETLSGDKTVQIGSQVLNAFAKLGGLFQF